MLNKTQIKTELNSQRTS